MNEPITFMIIDVVPERGITPPVNISPAKKIRNDNPNFILLYFTLSGMIILGPLKYFFQVQ